MSCVASAACNTCKLQLARFVSTIRASRMVITRDPSRRQGLDRAHDGKLRAVGGPGSAAHAGTRLFPLRREGFTRLGGGGQEGSPARYSTAANTRWAAVRSSANHGRIRQAGRQAGRRGRATGRAGPGEGGPAQCSESALDRPSSRVAPMLILLNPRLLYAEPEAMMDASRPCTPAARPSPPTDPRESTTAGPRVQRQRARQGTPRACKKHGAGSARGYHRLERCRDAGVLSAPRGH